MPFDATIKASSEKAASKLRDTLATGKLDGLSDQLKKATAALATAGGAALPAARGFNLGSVDGVASKRSLDLASLSSDSKKGLSTGAIAGIAIGAAAALALIVAAAAVACLRAQRSRNAAAAAAELHKPQPPLRAGEDPMAI